MELEIDRIDFDRDRVDAVMEWPLGPGADLSFDRTVDRATVHRRAVAEVFLTDFRTLDASRVVAAGQLPACHGYFSDHDRLGGPADPLLVMEVARQATLGGAHELGIPAGVVLISGSFDLEITDPDAWYFDGAAISVRVDSDFSWERIRHGRPTAGVCTQRIFRDGRLAARHRSSGRLMTHDGLAALREAQRGTPPPWSVGMPDLPDPEAVAPRIVGRRDPLNVVLAGLRYEGDTAAARIAPRLANRALFDHSYDHITMQILTEAARQLTVAAVARVGDGVDDDPHPDRPCDFELTGLTGTFDRFAELDAEATVRTALPRPTDGGMAMCVVVEQESETVAQIAVTFTPSRGNR